MRGQSGLNRRSFFYRVTGAALGAGALMAREARAQGVTDSDPTDHAYQGQGQQSCRDNDPSDPVRCGGATGSTLYAGSSSSARPIGFVLLVAGAGAVAAGTYIRRKKP